MIRTLEYRSSGSRFFDLLNRLGAYAMTSDTMQGLPFDLVQEHVLESGLHIDRPTDISRDLLTGTLLTLPWTRLGLAAESFSREHIWVKSVGLLLPPECQSASFFTIGNSLGHVGVPEEKDPSSTIATKTSTVSVSEHLRELRECQRHH